MKIVVMVMWGLMWIGLPQDQPKPAAEGAPVSKPTGDAAKKVNPVKSTPESIALGKKVYATDCEMCHGKDGAGDGDLAADMKLKLQDFRDASAMKDLSDGEMFEAIMNGKGKMSGEEGRMKPAQVWNVVNYVRSLAKK
jgi:mono/diheme cytochrome c family protein